MKYILYNIPLTALFLALGFMLGSIATTMSDPRIPQCYQGDPEKWTDFVVTYNCEIQTETTKKDHGLVIEISPEPVWWKCDNGWFYY